MFLPAAVCILLSVKIPLVTNVDTKKTFTIDRFNDIVQNITHINSVLQEFIKNYKQLQDIYKSVELTKDDVSDYVKRNKEGKYEEVKTTKTESQTMTPMFYSEEQRSKERNEVQHLNADAKKKYLINQEIKLKSRPNTVKIYHANILTTTEKSIGHTVTFEKVSGEEKRRETNEVHESTDVENQNTFKKPTTNRTLQSHETKIRRDVRKVIKYENFDGDIWDSIIQSRPIRYQYPRVNLRRTSKDAEKKAALVFLTKFRNDKKPNEENITPEDSNSIYDSIVASEINMENAILRAKGKFGRACFQYVVRRCFLALNEASKKACKELGCKKIFRRVLKESAKESCQKEFYGQMDNVTTTTPAPETLRPMRLNEKIRRKLTRRKHHHKHANVPSLGHNYLSTCYPHMLPASKRRQLDSVELPETFIQAIASAEIPDHSHEKSVLRNKYERACKKESAKRCRNSGRKTWASACARLPNDCKKRVSREYKKLASKYCKEAFGVKKQVLDEYEDSCSDSGDYSDYSEKDPFD